MFFKKKKEALQALYLFYACVSGQQSKLSLMSHEWWRPFSVYSLYDDLSLMFNGSILKFIEN